MSVKRFLVANSERSGMPEDLVEERQATQVLVLLLLLPGWGT